MPGKQARINPALDNVITILVQNKDDQSVLGALNCSEFDGYSGVGAVLDALLESVGLKYSDDGKSLVRLADPDIKLKWLEPKAQNTRSAREGGGATLDGLAREGLAHDADGGEVGGAARRALDMTYVMSMRSRRAIRWHACIRI